MKHGYEISHPQEPLSTFLQPPIQMAKPGHPQFKPEVVVGKSYHFQGGAHEVLSCLRGEGLENIKFVSPKDKLKNENSNEKVPSQPVRFKVGLISDESRSIEGQLGKVAVRLASSLGFDNVTKSLHSTGELLPGMRTLAADVHEMTNEKISLDISAYHNPDHNNVVSFESDRVSAKQLGDALEKAIINKLHHNTGRNLNAFQVANNQYAKGAKPSQIEKNKNNEQKKSATKSMSL